MAPLSLRVFVLLFQSHAKRIGPLGVLFPEHEQKWQADDGEAQLDPLRLHVCESAGCKQTRRVESVSRATAHDVASNAVSKVSAVADRTAVSIKRTSKTVNVN